MSVRFPPFPRPGTTKLLDNDAVAVWDVSWLKQKYPLHTHRYDLVGISYVEGDRIITQGDAPGRLVPTKAWVFQTNRAGVTHVEEGASDPPMRAVLIEVKSPGPRERAELLVVDQPRVGLLLGGVLQEFGSHGILLAPAVCHHLSAAGLV